MLLVKVVKSMKMDFMILYREQGHIWKLLTMLCVESITYNKYPITLTTLILITLFSKTCNKNKINKINK
jgi:hypothetical protein